MLSEEVLDTSRKTGNTRMRRRGSRSVAGVRQATPSGHRARVVVTTSMDVELEV